MKGKAWIALLIALPICFFVCGCLGLIGFLATRQNAQLMTREEWKAAVSGKTPEEVMKAVGPPNSQYRSTEHQGNETWVYFRKTRHPVTGNMENQSILFVGGKAVCYDQ